MVYFILINGKPHGRISAKRRIHQGDPISPFIFVLAMDYLSRLLSHLEKNNSIKGVDKLSDYYLNICLTHLLFADDIFLFVEDNENYLANLKMTLTLFEKASGLNINLSKSPISPINISNGRARIVADKWDIPTIHLSILYLGVPLGGNPKLSSFWDKVDVKINKKLTNWNYSQLSKAGKLTLINSFLSSLPTYQLSVFKAPTSTHKKNQKILDRFFEERFRLN